MMEQQLKNLLEQSQNKNGATENSNSKQEDSKMKFTEEETKRFQKAFEDEEFLRMFSEYMDELQDPKSREENEAYIKQLEGENKIPAGKELIRPSPGFVVKTVKIHSKDQDRKDKVFINIVSSESISPPTKSSTPQGVCWSLPYSLGPPHMEKDKNGMNATCFDCCYHPQAIQLSSDQREFRTLLVQTGIEGIEEAFRRQGQQVKLSQDFHIVKGIKYKEGTIPSMMIDIGSKHTWNAGNDPSSLENMAIMANKDATASNPSVHSSSSSSNPNSSSNNNNSSSTIRSGSSSSSSSAIRSSSSSSSVSTNGAIHSKFAGTAPADETKPSPPSTTETVKAVRTDGKDGKDGVASKNAIKKGFLNSASKSLYPEKAPPQKMDPSSVAAPQNRLISEVIDHTQEGSIHSHSLGSGKGVPPVASPEEGLRPISTSSKRPTDPSSDPSDPASSNGVEVPEYTITERGTVSLGDFDGIRSQVVPTNRPAELIVKFKLPKVLNASLVRLDVAERHLVIGYEGVYEGRVTLPYPVHDKKGKARFDKNTKTLMLTLPVKPHEVSVSPASAAPLQPVASEEVASEIQTSTTVAGHTSQESSSQPSHLRWVAPSAPSPTTSSSSEMEGSDQTLSESERLKREIQTRSAIALRDFADKQKQDPGHVSVHAPPPPQTKTEPTQGMMLPFEAAGSFLGRRPGYVYRNGIEGVGYYRDLSQLPPPPLLPQGGEETEVSSRTSCHEVDYEVQQNKQYLVVRVNVPWSMTEDSVVITYQTTSMEMAFRAKGHPKPPMMASSSEGGEEMGHIKSILKKSVVDSTETSSTGTETKGRTRAVGFHLLSPPEEGSSRVSPKGMTPHSTESSHDQTTEWVDYRVGFDLRQRRAKKEDPTPMPQFEWIPNECHHEVKTEAEDRRVVEIQLKKGLPVEMYWKMSHGDLGVKKVSKYEFQPNDLLTIRPSALMPRPIQRGVGSIHQSSALPPPSSFILLTTTSATSSAARHTSSEVLDVLDPSKTTTRLSEQVKSMQFGNIHPLFDLD